MTRARRITSLFILGNLATMGGCDSEAGQEYTGEVLLHIEGTVQATNEVDSGMVPALVLFPGDTTKERSKATRFLVDGNTSGEFPSRFTFEVTQTPPDEAMGTSVNGTENDKNEVPRALGYLAMVPEDHPATIPLAPLVRTDFVDDCATVPAGQSCTQKRTLCTDKSECITQQLDCIIEECSVVSNSGDKTLLADETSTHLVRRTRNKSTLGMWAFHTLVYDETDPSHNYQEVRVCNNIDTSYGGWSVDTLYHDKKTIAQCAVVSESGDTTVDDRYQPYSVAATNAIIFYSTEAVSQGWDILPVESGYNVFQRIVQTPDELAAVFQCREAAWFETIVEYNEAYGTKYREADGGAPRLAADLPGYDAIVTRVSERQTNCAAMWKKVSSGDEISLTLGPLPSS